MNEMGGSYELHNRHTMLPVAPKVDVREVRWELYVLDEKLG